MKRYNIKIETKNKMIPIKGRLVRSPVEFSIPDSNLSYYKTLIKKLGINEYTIMDFKNKEIKPEKIQVKKDNVKNIKCNNIREGEKKTLDKFL